MICCCCGYEESHGVKLGISTPNGYKKRFACVRCFSNPDLFFPANVVFPHWVTTKKLRRKVMKLCRDLKQKRLDTYVFET